MHHVIRRVIPARFCPSLRPHILTRLRSTGNQSSHDPLKVLFCGADGFSILSLQALHRLQQGRPDLIDSIDVVCRPDKRVGRGLRQTQQGVPIKGAALELGLRLHQIDTFKGWSPPEDVNLIVAVSFGLLVPSRIIDGAKYGGLNIHPSLLPDLRGPAPIAHTLLKRRPYTGVTLQTMHPTKFDHGVILAQTPSPYVPVSAECTPHGLLKTLGPLGANMLCMAIDGGIFASPVSQSANSIPASEGVNYAPKITPEDRRIDWMKWTSADIVLRDRVLGRLWDMEVYSNCFLTAKAKRVTFHGPWTIVERAASPAERGMPVIVDDYINTIGIGTADGKVIVPSSATIEGEGREKGIQTMVAGLMKSQQRNAA